MLKRKAWVIGLHKAFSDEEAPVAGFAKQADDARTCDATLADQHAVLGQTGCHAERVLHVCDEGSQVAIVHADGINGQVGVVQLVLRMQFEQDFECQLVSRGCERADFLLFEVGGNEQYGIRSNVSRLEKLVFVYDEILAKNGQIDQRSGFADKVERTAKVLLIGQDAEGSGTVLLVGKGNLLRFAVLLNPSSA